MVIGSRHFIVAHRILDQDDAARVLAGNERRNCFAVPIIHAVLNRLLGWRYDGSDEHRRQVAAQLPFVAFRPQLILVVDL